MILDALLYLVGIILTIFLVVGIHEGAHFLVARLYGIKILRCSIGFGKALYTWHDRTGTEYVIAAIPLGGYVKMLDESEGEVPKSELHLAYNRQKLYKRMAVVAAGPVSNLLAATLLYWCIFCIGYQTPVPIIGSVYTSSIASVAGLKSNLEIVAIDGEQTLGWNTVSMRLIRHLGNQDTTRIDVKPFHHLKTNDHEKTETYVLNLENWQLNDLKPDPLTSLGIVPYIPEIPLIIGIIKPNSPASGFLKLGDKIISVNNTRITHWQELLKIIDQNPETVIQLKIRSHNKISQFGIKTSYRRDLFLHKHGFLGIGPHIDIPKNLMREIQYPFFGALQHAVYEVRDLSYLNLLLFEKLATRKLSLLSLGGPITIFETAGSSFKYGLIAFLSFLAFLNVALGIINFFPIPGLDGGHILFQVLEGILGHPVALSIQMLFFRLGFIFLVLILFQALTNDLLRLWG